jgi:hypothetical protein
MSLQYCGEIENQLRLQQADGLAPKLTALNAEGERVLVAVRSLLPD